MTTIAVRVLYYYYCHLYYLGDAEEKEKKYAVYACIVVVATQIGL